VANRLTGRVKKLEERLNLNAPGTLIVIQQFGESKRQAIERTKKQYPNIKEYDLIFVMNFSNAGTKTRQD
jgi:predicted RNase H-like nuclease (RuvC/YqgF family)